MNKFKHILTDNSNNLRNICVKSKQIEQANQLMLQKLQNINFEHNCSVANIREEILIVACPDGITATKIRLYSQQILIAIQQKFPYIKHIKTYIASN